MVVTLAKAHSARSQDVMQPMGTMTWGASIQMDGGLDLDDTQMYRSKRGLGTHKGSLHRRMPQRRQHNKHISRLPRLGCDSNGWTQKRA